MYDVLNLLKGYTSLGDRYLENGTHLIGNAPHIAPFAWLHCIHSPLSESEIINLEKSLKLAIPTSYRLFLATANGLKVFNTTLSLDGLRNNYNRGIDDVWQPFDILTTNVLERPINSDENMFFIGGYDWDGSLLYIDRNTNKVHLCDKDDAATLFEWSTFDEMLSSEIERLIKLFDQNGKELDENQSTLPI